MTQHGRPEFDPDDEAVYRVSMLGLWLKEHPDDHEARSELVKWVWIAEMEENLRWGGGVMGQAGGLVCAAVVRCELEDG